MRVWPTAYLRPTKDSRIVREVVYLSIEALSRESSEKRVDILDTMVNVHAIAKEFIYLEYDIPKLLSSYDFLRPAKARDISIPWDKLPAELVEECLDSEYNLVATKRVYDYLGIRDPNKSSIFDEVEYKPRYLDEYDESIIRVPAGYYVRYSEELEDFERVCIMDRRDVSRSKSVEELEYVVEHFAESGELNGMGIGSRLMLRVLGSLIGSIKRYRREYYSLSYLERIASKPIEEVRREREIEEREYAISRAGRYSEDTSVLWRYGQLAD